MVNIMEIFEILKNSIRYPFTDIKTFLIIGVLFFASFISNFPGTFLKNEFMVIVGGIVSLIITIIVIGYELDVLKFGIELKDELPSIDIKRNLKNGIKLFIVDIIYYFIPLVVITIALFIFTGIAATKVTNLEFVGNVTPVDLLNTILTPDFAASIIIVAIVLIIMCIMFSLLALMGQSRLAKTGSIDDAIRFGKSYRDLKEIGVGKTLALIILLYILILVIFLIMAVISLIPVIGIIIAFIVGDTFIAFVQYRAFGLLYSEIA